MNRKSQRRNILRLAVMIAFLIGAWQVFDARTNGQQPQKNGVSLSPPPEWRPTQATADARYVGSAACRQCHTQTETQPATPMGQALEIPAHSRILSSQTRMLFKQGPFTYTITREGEKNIYSVSDGKETLSAPILYAFGQGKAGQTYVFEVQGKLHESRVSFYNEINGLDLTLGATREVPQTLAEAIGRPMSSIDAKDCFSCHATAAVSDAKLQLDKMTLGVTCEGCHGPGEKHLAAMKSRDTANRQIVNPGHFNADGQTEFCGSCHRTWSQVQLMRIRGVANVRFQPYRIFGSKCYNLEDKRIGCVACHNPHEQIKQVAAFYDSKCMACHNANAKGVTRVVQCRVGKENCAACHMPKYELSGSHFKFTDHRIRIVKPNEAYPD